MRTDAITRRAFAAALGLATCLSLVSLAGPVGAASKAKATKAKGSASVGASTSSGTAPSLRLDPADRDLAGIVPALPTVPGELVGRPGSMYFAVYVRGYQGTSEHMVIHGLEDEEAPCWRFSDSGGFAFATVLPGAIAWDPRRGADNGSIGTYTAIVHNWRNHEPKGCETQKWDDMGRAAGTITVRFQPSGLTIETLGVADGVQCKGGCPAEWARLLGNTVTFTPEQRAALSNPKVTEVVIPIRYRNSFTDNSPDTGTSQPCFYDELERQDVDCTWVGASMAYVRMVRLPSFVEFNKILQAGIKAAVANAPTALGGGGGAGGGGGSGSVVPSSGVGSPLVGWIPCVKEPELRRCMPS